MVRLYTSGKYFKDNEIIIDNDSFLITMYLQKPFRNSIKVMEEVDHAKLLDQNIGKIETPYGITGIQDLSTGCKTILNCIFCKRTRRYTRRSERLMQRNAERMR